MHKITKLSPCYCEVSGEGLIMFNPLLVFGVNGTNGAGDGILGRQSSRPMRGGLRPEMTNQRRGYGPSVVSTRHCNNYYSRLGGPITPHYPGAQPGPHETETETENLSYTVCSV